MPKENVEIIRSIYEAVNRGDWDAAFRDQRADVELTTPPGIFAGKYRGREECQGFFEDVAGAFEEWTIHAEELIESGDQVAAVIRFRAWPKGSSTEIEIRNGHLWTLRDGKTVSMQMFPKPREALEAARLSE